MELQALSQRNMINIVIHHFDEPRWEITNFEKPSRTVHLSHHNASHYNSVRMIDDLDDLPPQPILLLDCAAVAGGAAEEDSTREERMVMDGSGVRDLPIVQQTLEWFEQDVDATILFLLEDSANPAVFNAPPTVQPPKQHSDFSADKNSHFYFEDPVSSESGAAPAVLRRACTSDHEDLYDDPSQDVLEDSCDSSANPAANRPTLKPTTKAKHNKTTPPKKATSKKGNKPEKQLSNKERKLQKQRDKELASQVIASYDMDSTEHDNKCTALPEKMLASVSI